MSINLLLNNAVSALQANQAALSVTATNIANVNTPDYARREVHLSTTQAGNTLTGVEIAEVRRIYNEFLNREVLSTNAGSQYYDTMVSYHDRLQSMVGAPDQNGSLAGRLTELMAQFNEVSIDPTSLPRRTDLISDLQELAATISGLAGDIQGLRSDADQQFREKINRVNELTKQVYDMNSKIQYSVLSGSDPSALEDQRDTALKELGGLLDITVNREPNGKVLVSTTSGISLVGAVRYELDYTSSGLASTQSIFPAVTAHRVLADGTRDPNGQDFNHHITGGELGALLDLRDSELTDVAKQLGALSSTVIDALNRVHNDNVALPPQNSLIGINTGLLASDAHGFTGKTSLAIVGNGGELVRRVDVDFTAGTYSVDSGAPVGFGGTVGGLASALDSALGATGSVSFSNGVMSVSAASGTDGVGFLQDSVDPSGRAGRGFSHFFGLSNVLGADAPAHFETGLGLGDAHGFSGGPAEFVLRSADGQVLKEISYTPGGTTVGDLLTGLNDVTNGLGAYGSFGLSADGQVSFTPSGSYSGAVLASRGDATTRGSTGVSMSAFFGLGERFQMEQATGVKVDATVAGDQRFLGLAKLDLNPATSIGDFVITQSDNRGATAFNDIQNQSYQVPSAGRIVGMTVTLGEYTSTFLADTGQRAAHAEAMAVNSKSLYTEIESRMANERGVSLDEELSNMMVFQQSYNAAARMVTTAKEIYDALLSIA